MPKRSRTPLRRSGNHPAKPALRVVSKAHQLERDDAGKDPLAVALGRRGGLKGGKARAEKLTPDERRKSAMKAAKARWERKRS